MPSDSLCIPLKKEGKKEEVRNGCCFLPYIPHTMQIGCMDVFVIWQDSHHINSGSMGG